MNGIETRLSNFLDEYISLEKTIQKLIEPISRHYCGKCSGDCCREDICRESIQSAFLSVLINKQNARYNRQHGWLSPWGCRLDYGRPLVCYDYFCRDILNSVLLKTAGVQEIIRDFLAVGNKAYGNTHLVCVDNLSRLSSRKIEKMSAKISATMNKAANIRGIPPERE